MFRHLCLLAVAFLAVSDAINHIKDSKPCPNNGNKKTKTASFCVRASTSYISPVPAPPAGDDQAILTVTQGPLYDCNDNTPVGDDFFGTVSLTCTGLWDGVADGKLDGALQCSGIITVNTEDNKRAKQDFSSIAFTAQGPLDIEIVGGALVADVGPATGLVITGSNGAWGKSDNIKDITFTPSTVSPGIDTFEIEIEYKTKGFDPVA